MLDLFAYPSLRANVVLVNALFLLSYFTFSAPELVLNDTDEFFSIYQNGAIIGLSEIISCILSYFIINEFQRRWLLTFSALIGLFLAVLISIIADCTDNCTDFQSFF